MKTKKPSRISPQKNRRPKQKPKVILSKKSNQLLTRLKTLWENYEPKDIIPDDALKGIPGVYTDISFEDYTRIDAINFSSLKNLDISPAHYKNAPKRPESDSFFEGNLIHTAILEPQDLFDRYVILPDFSDQIGNDPKTKQPYKNPKATKAFKDLVDQFKKQHPTKQVIELELFNRLVKINKGVYSNSDAAEILTDSEKEVTIIWNDPKTGLTCKGRLDVINHNYSLIGDLKTTKDITRFENSISDYCYHQQQAHYAEGYYILTGKRYHSYIFAVEKQEPYACVCGPVDPDDILLGLKEIHLKLKLIQECTQNRSWPGPSNPVAWKLSPWYKQYTGQF